MGRERKSNGKEGTRQSRMSRYFFCIWKGRRGSESSRKVEERNQSKWEAKGEGKGKER